MPGDGRQPGGSADEQSGTDGAAITLTQDCSGKTCKSTTGGENAVLVVTLRSPFRSPKIGLLRGS